MPAPDWQRREFLDYKRRFHTRRSQSRDGTMVMTTAAYQAGSGFRPLLLLLPVLLVAGSALGYLMLVREGAIGGGSLQVHQVRGRVKASDDLKDWDLETGAKLHPGQRVVCGADGSVELRGADPDTRLLVFEGGSFYLKTLREVEDKKYLLEGRAEKGEVLFDFRSQTAIWGLEIQAPQGTRFLSKKVIMFKVGVGESGTRLVVGDGAVMAVGPGGEKDLVKADQAMKVTDDAPMGKPLGVNVLSERWNL